MFNTVTEILKGTSNDQSKADDFWGKCFNHTKVFIRIKK